MSVAPALADRAPSLDDAREVLRATFGHADFRGLQAGVIGEVLAGRNALAVLPTGGGKSMCYQVPALLTPGVALVVSPLIALMSDQVAALRQAGVAAARLDSNISPDERRRAWDGLEDGSLDLIYMSPEGLMQPATLERLGAAHVSLIAIDEAHCVSQWGHDFRPDYRMLGRLADVFPHAPRLAVTATADARTRADIRHELRLEDAAEFVDSFARPNLALSAERKTGGPKATHERVMELVRARPGRSGIVYAGSRDGTERLAAALRDQGAPAVAYHAGLDKDVRARRLTAFLEADEAVMVATIAFGMGIDKPDVRYVIHADPPASIEAYWQEVGRAGRDGEPAEGITLYGAGDMAWALRRIDEREAPGEVKAVQAGKARRFYAMLDGSGCRPAAVRRYFGEAQVEPCGACDGCTAPPKLMDATVLAQKALSAVHRMGGRFGRGRLVDHLLGRTKEVQASEKALPTWGIGGELPVSGWRDLIEQLLFDGLLQEDPNDGRPLVTLGDSAAVRAVYRGERKVSLKEAALTDRSRRSARTAGGGGAPRAQLGAATELGEADRHCAMEQVLELAHVAGKRIARQVHQRVAREARCRPHAGIARQPLEHALADDDQVFEPLAQRRHANLDDVEAVIQVLAELARLHFGAEVLVRRAQQPHVDRQLGDGTDRPHRALLNRAQQLALHRQRKVADLVEEQRAAVGRLKEAFAVVVGAGERALAIAKELGFEQLLRDGAAVDWHEGHRAAHAHFVNGARHQFLAGSRFAADQHRRHAARHFLDQRAHLLHRHRMPRHAAKGCAHRRRWRRGGGGARRPGGRRGAMLRRQARRIDRRATAAAAAERRSDDAAELLQIDRLRQIVVGTGTQGIDRVLRRPVRGDDDRLLAPAALLEPLQYVEAGAVGQPHVGDDGAVGAVLQVQQRVLHGAGGVEVVAFAQQRQLVERAQIGFIVDDEQAEVRCSGHGVR